MNHERMLELADKLEAGVEGFKFDMGVYLIQKSCGTVGCIAGLAAILWDDAPWQDYKDLSRKAAKILDLPEGSASWLFCGNWSKEPRMEDITAEEVVRELRRMVAADKYPEAVSRGRLTGGHMDTYIKGIIARILKVSGCKPSVSTGIHGYITYGYGDLDEFGFWEYPLPDGEYVR